MTSGKPIATIGTHYPINQIKEKEKRIGIFTNLYGIIPAIMHLLTWPIFVPLIKFFVGFRAIGKENLRNVKKPVIFVSNHESYFDPYILGSGIPLRASKLHPVYYLAKDYLFKKKSLKIPLWLYGAFPGRVGEGIEKALEKPTELLKHKKTIGIFPEWCYESEPEASRIRKVISLLSIKNNVPIIPTFIYGIYDGGICWKKIFRCERNVTVTFSKPIYPNSNTSEEEMEKSIGQSFLYTKLNFIESLHQEEKKFWSNYAKFYHYLEKADPYKDLIAEFNKDISNPLQGKWLDLGSGSGAVVDLLTKKMGNLLSKIEIFATDIEPLMLNSLSKRFSKNKNVKIKELDLAYSFNFPENYFDGITANLVLPYLIHHEGEIGVKGFIKLLEDIYKILKHGGKLIWSTPKKNVNFFHVFLASWKNILDFKNLEHLYYGPAILKQALQIQNKGKHGIYHFLDIEELKNILEKIGFTDINFMRSMAKQVDIISCTKI